MERKKLFLLTILFIGFSNFIFAQTSSVKDSNKISLNLGADLMSRYIWRGSEFGGNSPSIQPSMTLDYGNLELGAWGAYSLGGLNASQELDLYVNYNFFKKIFSLIVTDYFFPSETGNYQYFRYDKNTGHVFEAGLSFNGTDKFPVSFSGYVNFYGADALTIGDDPSSTVFNQKTGIQYSNYFEIDYSNNIKNVDYNLFLGFTLSNPKKANLHTGYIGESGYYGTCPGVINLGITMQKSILITKNYSLPVTASLITNPQSEKVYMVFGLSF